MGIRKPKNQAQPEPPLGSQTARLPEDAAPPEGDSKENVGPAAVAEGSRGSTDAVEAGGVPPQTPRRAGSDLSDITLASMESPGNTSEALLTTCIGCSRYMGVDCDYNNLVFVGAAEE